MTLVWFLVLISSAVMVVAFFWWPRMHRSSAFTDTSVGLGFMYVWPIFACWGALAAYAELGKRLNFEPVGVGAVGVVLILWSVIAFIGCFGVPLPWPLTPRWVLDVWRERRQERRAARRARRAEQATRRQQARL